MTRIDPPIPPFKEEEEITEEVVKEEKYKVKPPKELKSKFLIMLEQKEVDKVNAKIAEEEEAERQRLLDEEKRPLDELEGLRVHAWILMLAGQRDIETSFFIEPSTGLHYPLDTFMYNGIESIWNHVNYWVNMQDCSEGIANMEYDLTDLEKWEHLLIGEPVNWRKVKPKELGDEDERPDYFDEKHLDMPPSWSMKISIPHDLLKKRFPNGSRTTNYKRTILEEYAPYVSTDGLVTRVTRYFDFACTDAHTIEETYENRHDKMSQIIIDIKNKVVTEYYQSGREDSVIKQVYYGTTADMGNPKTERIIYFNSSARFDGMSQMQVQDNVVTVNYENREDRIHYRQVTLSKEKPKRGSGQRIPILSIIEKIERDTSIPANDDVAYRHFDIANRQFHLKFHYGKDHVTASTRTFIKPSVSEMGEETLFNPELTFGYQAELGAKPLSNLSLFLVFERQLKDEEKSVVAVRELETQIAEFLLKRAHELAESKLDVSLYNKEQNIEFRLAMLEIEERMRLSKEKETEEDMDFLGPYLAKLGRPKKLRYKQALEAKQACLNDFKDMLIQRANTIQRKFDKISELLATKKLWYTVNHDDLTHDEETQYFEEVNVMLFVLHCLEMQLNRHRDLSPLRYQALLTFLNNHPMLEMVREE